MSRFRRQPEVPKFSDSTSLSGDTPVTILTFFFKDADWRAFPRMIAFPNRDPFGKKELPMRRFLFLASFSLLAVSFAIHANPQISLGTAAHIQNDGPDPYPGPIPPMPN
jgi:hypothetical protein